MNKQTQILDAKIDGLHHRFTVALNNKEIEELVEQRIRKVQKTAQIKGFRRGKAPLKVIHSHYGARITNSIVDRLAIDVARNVITEKALQPLGRPIIDIINPDKHEQEQIRFTLTLEIFPQVSLNTVDNFHIERLQVVQEEDNADHDLHELSRHYIKRQIFDQLMRQYNFDVPGDMLKREYQRIAQTYRETIDNDISPELDIEFYQLAERRIRLAIVLTEIGRQYDIHIPREEVEQLVEGQAERDPEHASDIVDYYVEHPTAMAELQSTLFEERVVDYIVQQSVIRDRQVPAEELIALCEKG